MISVLIVEDNPGDREELRDVIQYAFPGSVVEVASDVDTAHNAILDLRERGLEFDFVIADVVVPASSGMTLPEGNSAEWDKLVNDVDRRRTLLILTSMMIGGDLHEVTIILKRPGATERIVSTMASYLINKGIEEVFGRSANSPFGREPDSSRGVGTIPVGRLTRNIYLFWKYLDAQQREYVRKYFDVVESVDLPSRVASVNFGARG